MTNKDKVDSREKERNSLKSSFNAVAKTPDGRAVLRYLMRDCGYNKSAVVQDPTTFEINTVSTVWNEAKKDVYERLRNYIDKEELIKIEFTED